MTARQLIDKLYEFDTSMVVRVGKEDDNIEHPIVDVVEEAGELRIEFCYEGEWDE